MNISSRHFSTLWTLFALLAIAGCSNAAPKPPGGQAHAGNGPATSAEEPEFVMNVTIQKGTRDDYETESVKTYPNPTAAQIEEQVRAHDWKNSTRRPYVGLAKKTPNGINVVRVEGQLGSPDPDAALRARWIGVEGEQEFSRRSPPLESLDAVIQLLVAFRNDDANLKTIAEWKLDATE